MNGIALSENIPLRWNDSTIKWKTKIHDNGYSSPVIYNNQIWITTAKPDGKELFADCIDFQTGKIIYDIKVFTPDEVEGKHTINTYASPTACIEKGFVYVHYGNMGTACINTANGSVVWKRTDFKCRFVQGPGSSAVIYKNLLILHFEGVDSRYIIALDKSNGKLIWRSDRPAEPYEKLEEISRKAYITPIIINVKGRDMLISNGSAICIAYDPNTGNEIWRVVNGAESTVAMPFTENGVVYWYAGYMVDRNGTKFTELLAVNPAGAGDITGTNILWKKHDEQYIMNPNTIREFASSFQKSRILLSGFELDIFTNVDESGTTNNQIANNLHLDEHACERLLNALVSLGFLTKQNHLFFNTAESFAFLSKKSSDYLGGLMHSNHLWNTWSNLTQVVKTG